MTFLYFKALHIIFVVTWFAGLFYFPRLLIYATEAAEKTQAERQTLLAYFLPMQRRLWYGITWPSAIITLVMGLSTWYNYGATPDWLVHKLVLVAGLYAFHYSLHILFRQQQRGDYRYTSTQLRVWNEVSTVFLFGIVFLVVLKDALSMLWGLLGLALLIGVLLVAIRVYKSMRQK